MFIWGFSIWSLNPQPPDQCQCDQNKATDLDKTAQRVARAVVLAKAFGRRRRSTLCVLFIKNLLPLMKRPPLDGCHVWFCDYFGLGQTVWVQCLPCSSVPRRPEQIYRVCWIHHNIRFKTLLEFNGQALNLLGVWSSKYPLYLQLTTSACIPVLASLLTRYWSRLQYAYA